MSGDKKNIFLGNIAIIAFVLGILIAIIISLTSNNIFYNPDETTAVMPPRPGPPLPLPSYAAPCGSTGGGQCGGVCNDPNAACVPAGRGSCGCLLPVPLSGSLCGRNSEGQCGGECANPEEVCLSSGDSCKCFGVVPLSGSKPK